MRADRNSYFAATRTWDSEKWERFKDQLLECLACCQTKGISCRLGSVDVMRKSCDNGRTNKPIFWVMNRRLLLAIERRLSSHVVFHRSWRLSKRLRLNETFAIIQKMLTFFNDAVSTPQAKTGSCPLFCERY